MFQDCGVVPPGTIFGDVYFPVKEDGTFSYEIHFLVENISYSDISTVRCQRF